MLKKISRHFLKIFSSLFVFSIIAGQFFITTFSIALAADTTTPPPTVVPAPVLQVAIPGVGNFSSNVGSGNNWLGQYVVGLYNYAIGITGILSAVILMYGGFLWTVAAGNASKISEAQTWIGGAILGLILVMTSYTILSAVNPDLLKPGSLNITSLSKTIPVSDISTKEVSKDAMNDPNAPLPAGVKDDTIGCCIVSMNSADVCKDSISMKQCKELGVNTAVTKSFRASATCDRNINYCVVNGIKEKETCDEANRCDVGLACYNGKCTKEEDVVCLSAGEYSPCHTTGIPKGYCSIIGENKICKVCRGAKQKCHNTNVCPTVCCSGLFEYLQNESYNVCQ